MLAGVDDAVAAVLNPPCPDCGFEERVSLTCDEVVELVGKSQHDEVAAYVGGAHTHLFCPVCEEPSTLGAPEVDDFE